MTWCVFPTQAAFDAWHNPKCQAFGIPKPGARQSDNAIQLGNQWTTSYVRPVVINGSIVANVPDIDVAADKLTPVPAPLAALIAKMGDLVAPTPVAKVAFTVDKPLPATWKVNGVDTPVPAQNVSIA